MAAKTVSAGISLSRPPAPQPGRRKGSQPSGAGVVKAKKAGKGGRRKSAAETAFDDLPWKRLDVNMASEEPGFFMLEEIDGSQVDVVRSGNAVRLVSRSGGATKQKPAKKQKTAHEPAEQAADHADADADADVDDDVDTDVKQPEVSQNKPKPKKEQPKMEQPKKEQPKKQQPKKQQKQQAAKAAEDEEAESKAIPVKLLSPEWSRCGIHPFLLEAVARLGFQRPTPIQSRTIPLAVGKTRDIIGIAQTGSGKTLAFGIPLVHHLLHRRKQLNMATTAKQAQSSHRKWQYLPALVLSPTRELALQIVKHLTALCTDTAVKAVAVVGGMAQQKQERQLDGHPDIVVATPGRLVDLMSQGLEYLKNLKSLQFLVLDEADRMVEQGHFPELEQVVKAIVATGSEVDVESLKLASDGWMAPTSGSSSGSASAASDPDAVWRDYPRQTLCFSATNGPAGKAAVKGAVEQLLSADLAAALAAQDAEHPLDASAQAELVKSSRRKHTLALRKVSSMQLLMRRLGVRGQPALVQTATSLSVPTPQAAGSGSDSDNDVDTGDDKDDADAPAPESESSVPLPSQLRVCRYDCLDDEKDQVLYSFLIKHPGRVLIFVNAISTLRRLTSLLTTLALPVQALHANMQQRQRLKNLDRFRKSEAAILVATDVAARGLDIPSVQYVVHYHLPRNVDMFVHRSGRTARAAAAGLALALVGPTETKLCNSIVRQLNLSDGLTKFPLDHSFMKAVIARLSIARKIETLMAQASKKKSTQDWLAKTVKDADLDVDDDMLASLGLSKGDSEVDEDRETANQLKALRGQLRGLMQQTLLPRGTSRKYLTNFTSQQQAAVQPLLGAASSLTEDNEGESSDADDSDASDDDEFDREYFQEMQSSNPDDAEADAVQAPKQALRRVTPGRQGVLAGVDAIAALDSARTSQKRKRN